LYVHKIIKLNQLRLIKKAHQYNPVEIVIIELRKHLRRRVAISF
jgi:hypothetical protein